MALKDVHETMTPVELDKPRLLKFDLNAFAELEERFGSMEKAFAEMQRGSLKAARTLLWAGLLHEDETLTEKRVGGMVTLSNITDVIDKITSALTEAVPDSAEGGKATTENPT